MSKFTTLTHNGPIFPPEYEVKGFKLANEDLSPLAEEMMWHYAAKRDTDYVKIERFNKNFYSCLKPELTSNQQLLEFPKDFEKLINDMFNKNQQLKEQKANSAVKKVTKKEWKLAEEDVSLKKRLEARQKKYDEVDTEKAAMKEKYGFAFKDGKKEPLGSFMIEPPGIIMTRGDSSILGMWKYRTVPEDIIINYVSKDKSGVPVAPAGHNWKKVVSDNNSCQTVMYFVQVGRPEFGISPRYKRIIFAAKSDTKKEKDMLKFEKARKLVQMWPDMEKHIMKGMVSPDAKRQEAATIASLIKTTGIRVGNDKDESAGYAETVGASTLEVGNVELIADYKVKLDFMGKDSVRYENTVQLDQLTYNALKKIIGNRSKDELVFKNASSNDVAAFLKEFMPECSPKLFRSAYGCKLISEELHKAEKDGKLTKTMPISKKIAVYDNANLEVAKKLNHQRALPKNFDTQMEKLDKQIEDAIKKEAEVKAKAEAELKKVLDQAKLAKKEWEGEKLTAALERIKERKEKITAKVEKSAEKIEKLKDKREMKDKTKNYSLTTSRTAYSTPALAVSFCKKFDIDISNIYSKSLQEKFDWAMDTPESYYDNFPKEAKK
jgi:DNA topoisomerase-1